MSEDGNFGGIPFTQDLHDRCWWATVEMEESVNYDADQPSLLAALVRVWLESAALGAMHLGGVADINWCRAEFLASCSRAFDYTWDQRLFDLHCCDRYPEDETKLEEEQKVGRTEAEAAP